MKRSVTEVGRYLKKLRTEERESLTDMAKKLDVSASFLSAVELGKKSIPDTLVDKIQQIYLLNEAQCMDFFEARSITNSKVEIILDEEDANTKRNDVAISFGWKFLDLSEEQISRIKNILDEDDGKHEK